MKYTRIMVDHYGGPEVLRVVEGECQEAKAGEVLVRVLAGGRGMPDVMAREGIHPETPSAPYTAGCDAEIHRLTPDGVDVVFDPIGGAHLWQSRQALRRGGKVGGYGSTTVLRAEGLDSGRGGRRNRLHGLPIYALYIANTAALESRAA